MRQQVQTTPRHSAELGRGSLSPEKRHDDSNFLLAQSLFPSSEAKKEGFLTMHAPKRRVLKDSCENKCFARTKEKNPHGQLWKQMLSPPAQSLNPLSFCHYKLLWRSLHPACTAPE
jgi:hypothetical protein